MYRHARELVAIAEWKYAILRFRDAVAQARLQIAIGQSPMPISIATSPPPPSPPRLATRKRKRNSNSNSNRSRNSHRNRNRTRDRKRRRDRPFVRQLHRSRGRDAPPADVALGWRNGHILCTSPVYVIIMARPDRVLDEPSRELVENALFDSGRPVLLVPERTLRPDGTIVISWTDTVETARALTSAMPLLRFAQSVHLVSVQKEHEPPPQAERAVQALLRHGIKAQCSIVSERVSVGRTVLEFAKEINADLLIKGAYTQTRLRRLIFGGTTDYILSHCQIPVLLAH